MHDARSSWQGDQPGPHSAEPAAILPDNAAAEAGDADPRLGEEWLGWRVTDELGRSIGYVEGRVGDRWLIVGRPASDHILAPVADAIAAGGTVFLPYPHELIDSAPLHHPAAPFREQRLRSARGHYGLS